MELYVFGHLRDDGTCYNPFAYSDNKQFIEGFANESISKMNETDYFSLKKANNLVSWEQNGKLVVMGIEKMNIETIDYVPENYSQKCSGIGIFGSTETEIPDPEKYKDWILVLWKEWTWKENKPLFMPRQSTVFQSLGNGFVLRPL
jgi:hypothetical protein